MNVGFCISEFLSEISLLWSPLITWVTGCY